MKKQKIILGITGASGSIYGKLLLDRLAGLREQIIDCSVIFSVHALEVWKYELGNFEEAKKSFERFLLYAPKEDIEQIDTAKRRIEEIEKTK